jgi:Phage tail tube protein
MSSQKGIGRLISVGVAKETTRGTAIASAAYWNPWNDLTLDEKKEFAVDAQSYGIIEDSVNLTQTKKWAQGTIGGNVADTTIGLIFYSMFGGYAAAAHGAEAAVYDHTFTVAESAQHKSLTFFLHDPLSAVDYSYANGVVEKLEINMALKKFVEFNASIKTQSGVAQSAFSPSTTSENRFVPQYISAGFSPQVAGLLAAQEGTGTAATSVHVTALSFSTDLLAVGMYVVGTNITSGTTIASIVSNTAFDLSGASTGNASDIHCGTLYATGTASSTIHVTSLSVITTASLRVGMTVKGTNIPAGTTIAKIVSSTAFDLSAASTGAVSGMVFGPAVVALKSLKLSINGNIEDQDVLGSVSPADFLNKEFAVEGSFEAIWQNETDAKTAFMGPTSQAMNLTIQNTDVTIGTAMNPTLQFLLAKCTFQELGRPFKVKDLVYQSIKLKAVYSVSDTYMIKAILSNTVSSY